MSTPNPDPDRALGGVLLSLAAAATFGVLGPAAKGVVATIDPVRGAGLSYLAAGVIALLALSARRAIGYGAAGRRIERTDLPRLGGMILFGGIVGPVLFFAGVARVAAHQAAIVQHLEFAVTVIAAIVILGERPGRRGYSGLALVGVGLVLFALPSGRESATQVVAWGGVLLIAAACLAWAVDNTLARGASDLDPFVVVSLKGCTAGVVLVLAKSGTPLPTRLDAWGLLLLAGGVGIFVSLVFELLALRRIGATLNAGLFATGPAFGFAWSLIFLGERAQLTSWIALAVCVVGAIALATDRHEHWHVHEDGHERVEHSHPHVHDDRHRHRH